MPTSSEVPEDLPNHTLFTVFALCFSGANIWSGVTACDIVWYGDQILQWLSSTFPHEENTLTSLEDHTGDLFVS